MIRVTTEQPGRLGAVILIVLLATVGAAADTGESPYPIPDGVLASAHEYVTSRVGEAFFDSCMTWSPELSCFRPLDPDNVGRSGLPDWLRYPRYVIIYRLQVPELSFVDEIVVVNIKEDGGWFQDVAHDEGLPDCVASPGECEFPVDEVTALETARKAGLQEGNKPWVADFRWFGHEHQTYAWLIQNELGQSHGEFVLVDANDGAVIEKNTWRVRVEGSPPTAP